MSKKTKKRASARRPKRAQRHLQLAAPTAMFKLDLGCGRNPREGFEGVDLLAPNAKHKVDLFKFPWPWPDNSVDELHSSHFVEHIPCREIEPRDLSSMGAAPNGSDWAEAHMHFVGQDMLFAFFDECYRILKPEAWLTVIVPSLQSVRAFQDPTHRRFIPQELFSYLNRAARESMQLEHYRVRCDFHFTTQTTVLQDFNALSPEVQQRRMMESWNVTIDYHAKMKAYKPTPEVK